MGADVKFRILMKDIEFPFSGARKIHLRGENGM